MNNRKIDKSHKMKLQTELCEQKRKNRYENEIEREKHAFRLED